LVYRHRHSGLDPESIFFTHITVTNLQNYQDLLKAFAVFLAENSAMPKQPCVYILTNQPRGTLYVGVTSNLVQRVWQHKNHFVKGFVSEYGLTHLVYYQVFEDMYEAIRREKVIKNWKRIWKIQLIEEVNPNWVDMYSQIT